jgi:hypothetical protein
MFASVYTGATLILADNQDVTFDTTASIDTATLTGGGTSITLGGSGASATFLISWAVSTSGASGTFALMVNGVEQPALKAGLGGGNSKWITSTAIITIADDSVLTLRNLSTTTFVVNPNGNGSSGSTSASLTILKIK